MNTQDSDRRPRQVGSPGVDRLEALAAHLLGVDDVRFVPSDAGGDEAFTAGVIRSAGNCVVDSLGEDAPAYLGVPVVTPAGDVVGALRATAPQRSWCPEDVTLLEGVAAAVEDLVSLARANRELAGDLMTQSAQEDRLRESQQRVRLTFDHAPIAEAIVGLDGRWLEANAALCHLLGYTPEELHGLTFQDLTHPEDLDADLALVGALLEGHIPAYSLEKRYLRRDGGIVRALLHVSLVRSRAGEPRYFISQIEDITERHRRREELRRASQELRDANTMLSTSVNQALTSEARYRALVDHLPDTAVHVYDRDRRILMSSGPGVESRGFEESDLIGRRPGDVLGGADAAFLDGALSDALGGRSSRTERRSERTGMDQLVDVVPLDHGRPGPPEEILVVSRDISAIKDRERALARAEARWRAAFEGAPVGIAELTLDGTVRRVNPAICDLTASPPDALEGRHLSDLLHPEDRSDASDDVSGWTGGSSPADPRRSQWRLLRADGDIRWVNVRHSVIPDASGEPSHLLVHLSDVTDEHANREELEASRARFAALVEHGSDVIAILGSDLLLRYVSPASRTVFGLSPTQMVGASMLNGVHPDDVEPLRESYRSVVREAQAVVTFDARIQHADGSWRTIESTVSNRLTDPAVLGLVCNCRDVTDRVEVAERLAYRAMHDDLTGLPNRSLILDRLDQAMARAHGTGHPCALLYIDLDRFKRVNDDHGHEGGDQLLVAVAERLRGACRPGDSVGRIGGDEFVLLADGISDINIALDIAERVRHAVMQPIVLEGETVAVGCSVGIALSADDRPELLLRAADAALYRAKANGRNRWELSVPSDGLIDLAAGDGTDRIDRASLD